MKKSLVLLGATALAVLLVTSASADNRGVQFTGIGFHPDAVGTLASSVTAMNPDGTVFMANPSFFGNYCFLWTPEGGWSTEIGQATSTCRISSEGTIMASGLFPGSNPGYAWPGTWAGAPNVWEPIPENDGYAPCGGSRMSFFDMGGDGDYAVGLTWSGCSVAQGFRWDKATNTSISLGRPNGRSTRANAVSADGDTVIGWGTMLQGLRRGARWEDGTWTFLNDPNATEPKVCAQSGGACTGNFAGTNGCPEFVNDGFCENRGTCTAGVCVGGINAGGTCTSNSQCPGTCAGPNAGNSCTSDFTCSDTLVCIDNPAWSNELFKGEAYDVTDDGQYACGRNYDYNAKWTSGYRANPDGSFTELPPPATFPDLVDPFRISQDGKTVVGRAGNPFFGSIPIFWNEGMGTVDLQLFLVQQGLDELFFWFLLDVFDVSADGTVIGGRGINPDGLLEGFIVDMEKLWVCHAPPGNPEGARTLGVSFETVGDHMAHGDFLGTCEFMNSGGLSRAAELRSQLNERKSTMGADSFPLFDNTFPPSWQSPAEVDVEAPLRPDAARRGGKVTPRTRN